MLCGTGEVVWWGWKWKGCPPCPGRQKTLLGTVRVWISVLQKSKGLIPRVVLGTFKKWGLVGSPGH